MTGFHMKCNTGLKWVKLKKKRVRVENLRMKNYAYISICDKVFKNEPGKICGRQPLKNLKGYGLLKQVLS